MKYSVYVNSSLRKIPRETEEIHISRPLRMNSLDKLLKKCKGLNRITLSKSCLERLSGRVKKKLENKEVELMLYKAKGRPLSVDLAKMLRIIELKQDYRSYGEIATIVEVPKSTAHYLIKYADRTKIKKGKQVIHLK
jgi:hypothetical protein